MQTEVLLKSANIPAGVTTAHRVASCEAQPYLQPVLTFSTSAFPPPVQLSALNAHCGAVIEMMGPASSVPGFVARATTWRLGPLLLGSLVVPAARFRRRAERTRGETCDHWVIAVAKRGSFTVGTADGTAEVAAGMPYVFSLADAFEGGCSDTDWLFIIIPRETFPELVIAIDRCRGAVLTGSMGVLLGRFLSSLESELPLMTEAELPRLVAATQAIVAACIAPSIQAGPDRARQIEYTRRERVRQAIRRQLRSPTLTPARLCRLVGMSRSQLYRLFEPLGGVARYIQAERLRETYRALADPGNARRIREVAEDLGFYDASAFSRAFRREFGCTPTEVRSAVLSGMASAPLRLPAETGGATDLASLLRRLQ
jgi:AraC-like DNA-binding protein